MTDPVALDLTGVTLSVRWWTTARAFTRLERDTTAALAGIDAKRFVAKKNLIDTDHTAWQAVCSVKTALRSWWDDNTIPYTISGVRLVGKDRKDDVLGVVNRYAADLAKATWALDDAREEIIAQSRIDLNGYFREDYFPQSWAELLSFSAYEVSIEPPSYLKHTKEGEYKKLMEQSVANIEASMVKYEQRLWSELAALTEKLHGMMTSGKVYETTVQGFKEVFDRTAKINFSGTACFRQAMADAKGLLSDVSVADLRRDKGLRESVKGNIEALTGRFEKLATAQSEPLAVAG